MKKLILLALSPIAVPAFMVGIVAGLVVIPFVNGWNTAIEWSKWISKNP